MIKLCLFVKGLYTSK